MSASAKELEYKIKLKINHRYEQSIVTKNTWDFYNYNYYQQ